MRSLSVGKRSRYQPSHIIVTRSLGPLVAMYHDSASSPSSRISTELSAKLGWISCFGGCGGRFCTLGGIFSFGSQSTGKAHCHVLCMQRGIGGREIYV